MGQGVIVSLAKTIVGVTVTVDPITVDKPTAAAMLGIGDSMLMDFVSDGKLNAKKLGSRTVFLIQDLRDFAASLPSWEPKA